MTTRKQHNPCRIGKLHMKVIKTHPRHAQAQAQARPNPRIKKEIKHKAPSLARSYW